MLYGGVRLNINHLYKQGELKSPLIRRFDSVFHYIRCRYLWIFSNNFLHPFVGKNEQGHTPSIFSKRRIGLHPFSFFIGKQADIRFWDIVLFEQSSVLGRGVSIYEHNFGKYISWQLGWKISQGVLKFGRLFARVAYDYNKVILVAIA